MWHHFFRESAEAFEHLFLRDRLERIQQEVYAIDTACFPLLELAHQTRRIADRESAEGQPETAHPALGGVDLSARTRDCDPERRMRFLIWLGHNRALRHRPRASPVRVAFLGPHLRQAMDEFVPSLFGFVWARAE